MAVTNEYQKQFVLTLLAYAVQRDISAQHLCKLSGIDLDALRSAEQPSISPAQINDLWHHATHLSKDPLFGLHLGESMQLAALGIVGELIKSSRTIGEGISHAASFANLLTDAFKMEVKQTGKTFHIRFTHDGQRSAAFPETFRQMMDLSLVMTIHELDGLVLKKIAPLKVLVPFNENQRAEYARTLRCEPTLSNEYQLDFDARLWDEPIISANYELQHSLLKFATAATKYNVNPPPLRDRVGQYLVTHAYLGIPTIEAIASNFNLSARTLQRKLSEEGITYQEISDGTKKSLALNYLHSGTYQVKEISMMLGYNELSAFTRAFKRWTGNSPGRYQQERRSNSMHATVSVSGKSLA